MAIAGGRKHRVHAGFTLLAPLRADRVEAAAALLARGAADPAQLPFARSATTHFATLTIIPAQHHGEQPLPATLLVATSFCGPFADHALELVRVLGAPLRALLEHCRDFTPGCSDGELLQFLVENRHPDTFYSGMHHLSPADVRQHQQLREAIEAFVDEGQLAGAFEGKSAVQIQRAIAAHVRGRSDLAWAQEPIVRPRSGWWAKHWRGLAVGAVALPIVVGTPVTAGVAWAANSSVLATLAWAGLAVIALALALVIGLFGAMRAAEREQDYVAKRPPDPHARALAATQNRPVINEFVIAGPIKNGALRPLFLRLAMWIVARAAEGVPWLPPYRDGIHIPTVATARWIAADRGRRLIFLSSYTNAAEPYVRDFIDVPAGAQRINLTFGFGRGYPPTRYVLWDGALTDPNAFLHVVAENQHPTGFWYGPYANLSIDNIVHNAKIHAGLFSTLDEDRAQAWLHLL